MLLLLIHDEKSEEPRREFDHGVVRFFGREVMAEYLVFVAASVVMGDKSQWVVGCRRFSFTGLISGGR